MERTYSDGFQTVYRGKNPHRKAWITRITANRWAYRLGWESEVESKRGGECKTRKSALFHVAVFLDD